MGEDYTHNQDRSIQYQASDAVFQIHNYNLDLKANSIYLVGEDCYAEEEEPGVEFLMANRFIKNLNIIQRKSEKPILIILKTCGGDWTEGMAIYDAIKASLCWVTILAYAHARSMTSIIMQAADRRVMMPNADFLFHHGTMVVENTLVGAASDVRWHVTKMDVMLDIYADKRQYGTHFKDQHPKTIKRRLQREMEKKQECYLTATESVDWGFADSVLGDKKTPDRASLRKAS